MAALACALRRSLASSRDLRFTQSELQILLRVEVRVEALGFKFKAPEVKKLVSEDCRKPYERDLDLGNLHDRPLRRVPSRRDIRVP